MINVQIDLWPYGNEKRKSEIANIRIANIHTNMESQDAIYGCTVYDNSGKEISIELDHNRKDGIYVLLQKVIKEVIKQT